MAYNAGMSERTSDGRCENRIERLRRVPSWAQAGVLIVLALVVYLPAMQGDWIWGDDQRVYNNPFYKDASGLHEIWFSTKPKDYWPLFYTSFWIQWQLWGENTLGYHIVNAFFHGLVAVLFWRVLLRLRVPGAWLSGLIFAVHPVHVDSVAWISEFVNPLSGTFYLLAALFYLRCDEQDSWRWWAASLIAFVLAMLSKASTAMLPAILVLCRLWLGREWRWRDVVRLGGFLAPAVGLSIVTIWFQKYSAAAYGHEWSAGFAERTAVAGHIVWFYLLKALVPYHLMFVYPKWQIDPNAVVSYLPATAVLVLAVVFACRWTTWGRCMFVGLGSFVVALFPVLGYFDMYYMQYSYVADHWQYLASMGAIAWAVGLGAWAATQVSLRGPQPTWRRAPVGGAAVGLIVAAIFGVATWRHSRTYTDLERLWRATLATDNNVAMVHVNLGTMLAKRARGGGLEADRHAGPHMRRNPAELLEEAEHHFREAIRIKPDDDSAHANLGAMLFLTGDTEAALVHYRHALKIDPFNVNVRTRLGKALFNLRQLDAAAEQYGRVLRLYPAHAGAQLGMAGVRMMQGRWSEAIDHHRRAIAARPDDAAPLHRLAWLLATCPDERYRNGAEALSLARRASALMVRPDPLALDALAAALAEVGDFAQAHATAVDAARLARQRQALALAEQLRKRAEVYRAGRRVRGRSTIPTSSIPSAGTNP